MQKRIRIVSIGIILVVLFISAIILNNNTNNKHTFKKDGILYAVSLDGKSITSFPSKGLYKANVSCEGADGKWLYDDWKLAIENITGDVSCDIKFETITKTYLNDYITGLAGTTQGTGQVVNENGYRYEGKNPNNYVWFNNEYWRIIGVFDSNSHGQSGKNLAKIIRADVLNGLAWSSRSPVINWSEASLNKLLNGAYYNAQDGTSSGYCYVYANTGIGNCDYTKKGIQPGYRKMIANVTWYLGDSRGGTAENSYGNERGATSTTGYIGLMYPSDYGYSVLSSNCARTTELGYYSSNTCAGASWLYGKVSEWTLSSAASAYFLAYNLSAGGAMVTSGNHIFNGLAVRPVLYLDASVYKIDGEGTLDKPYIIGM